MRSSIKTAKRIVFKIGSSSLTHKDTGALNLRNLEALVRVLSDLRNQDKDVVLVTSGAVALGRQVVSHDEPLEIGQKQALASIGQAQLMMLYQRYFSDYGHNVAQVLMSKDVFIVDKSRDNARRTFEELLKMGVIPIVNENDTISTDELLFGDNDRLSASVLTLVEADVLIILSDIDSLYSDDPNINKDAKPIHYVEVLQEEHYNFAKSSSSSLVGTGGMSTKILAAHIATSFGADMILMSAHNMEALYDVLEGKEIGTFFKRNKNDNFNIKECLE